MSKIRYGWVLTLVLEVLNPKNQNVMSTQSTFLRTRLLWSLLLCCFVLITVLSCGGDIEPIDPPITSVGDGDENPTDEPEEPEEPEEEVNPDLDAINEAIAALSYDPERLLNVQSNTGTDPSEERVRRTTSLGTVTECRTIDYNIRSNFQDVVMFDPTLAVVYPGALVIGNADLLNGVPQPLQISKAPTQLRVDLPGIGQGGNITVDDPTYRNTQAKIDETLEYWNAQIQPQGYEIDSEAYFEKTTAYTREQMSLDLGVSAEWSTGSSFDSQFNYTKTEEKRVATLLYRQVFYEVIAETPDSPAAMLGNDVDLETAQSVLTDEAPPAYVSSVQYGRIIMMRMETTDTETDVNLEAVLEYKTATRDATVEINTDYEKVIRESTINIVTIGGNAEIASRVISGSSVDEGQGGLNYVIEEGSLYSRNNPGAPIGYTVKYLKDNRIAKMGYNTDYRIERCGPFSYVHKNARLRKKILPNVRFRFSYKKEGTQTRAETAWETVNKQNIYFNDAPPKGAHDVVIQFQFWDLVWRTLGEEEIGYLDSERCYEAFCSKRVLGVCTEYTFQGISCN
ncbi:MAG: thiol-activated cytolysin family protein [Bacteroidota bacterium]